MRFFCSRPKEGEHFGKVVAYDGSVNSLGGEVRDRVVNPNAVAHKDYLDVFLLLRGFLRARGLRVQ